MTPGPLKVFLCHSSADKTTVRELYDRLLTEGWIDPWLDEKKLLPGQDWDLAIEKAVEESHAVIVCVSNSSVTKEGYIQKELRFVLDIALTKPEEEIFVIPLRLEDCQPPRRLRAFHYVDYFPKAQQDNAFKMLLESLKVRAGTVGVKVTRNFIPTPTAAPQARQAISPIEPQMIRIPAGKFLMGSSDKDKDANDDEKPQHTVNLSEYYIGKYPVTNLQYQAFVKDAKYKTPAHWQGGEIPQGKANHPVVFVSWDDAVAYCKWLSKKTGKNYRLPTEAEWEKAARGTDGRIYPWGDEFDENKCNTSASRIDDTSEVGRFSPQGDSPYGCVDMAGNVREWTRSLYKPYPYDPNDGREDLNAEGARVLRGGSFIDIARLARCAYRDSSDVLYDNGGFRVAASSFSPV